jgi:hypothetical protein
VDEQKDITRIFQHPGRKKIQSQHTDKDSSASLPIDFKLLVYIVESCPRIFIVTFPSYLFSNQVIHIRKWVPVAATIMNPPPQ